MFAGNDLPGVMLAGGVRRLIALYGIAPGTRAVVATTSDRGLEAARALEAAGVEVAAIADLREGRTVLEAEGRKHVRAAVLGGLDGSDERRVECDLLVMSGGVAPATSLHRAGRRAHRLRRARAGTSPWPSCPTACTRRARSPARATTPSPPARTPARRPPMRWAWPTHRRRRADGPPERRAPEAVPPAVAGAGRGKCFACLCEDVTAKDIHLSVDEGYDSIELSKRYTTATMGPCQGRMCQLPAVRLMAQETGQDLERVGTTTARPPWSAVPLGALAGRPIEPAKRSAIHPRHRELGARVMWAGDWRRAYDYGDPQGEALAVHESAGLIDVSTLGKLIVRGPEAGEFLDRLYPNRFANLEPGRIRYGVLTSDAGRIMDDGTICRLDDESFYVTTTSSGAGAVEQWFSWWLADWRMQVTLTDVTQGLAAVNLAGPRAREIMGRLTELDCSNEAFAYLDAKRAPVAGVPALLLRIGFVGEVGYEIHFPAAHGRHVWDAILEAGAEHGIRPFGLEPQRILRLQKQHILVGQDTDSESTPYGAAMPWIVKLDKDEDFIGKMGARARRRASERDGAGRLHPARRRRPDRGRGGARRARRAHRAGHERAPLAPARARHRHGVGAGRDGQRRRRDHDLRRRAATCAPQVMTRPFYDPDGEVLRS